MELKGYKQLQIWQKSMELTVQIYRIVKLLPKEELYALSDQMRRAAVSIPSNIAEGHSRSNQKEFIHFLNIAKGSNAELFTQLLICERVGYISPEKLHSVKELSDELARMITSFIKNINNSNQYY
ncbi:MAG: four helix bundle protein [Clostridia bacterium]|nr:four helix bundle protein [Clostridia bacterium]